MFLKYLPHRKYDNNSIHFIETKSYLIVMHHSMGIGIYFNSEQPSVRRACGSTHASGSSDTWLLISTKYRSK